MLKGKHFISDFTLAVRVIIGVPVQEDIFVVFVLCGTNFLSLKVSTIWHYLLTVSNPVVTIICYLMCG